MEHTFFQEQCRVVENRRIREGFFVLELEGPRMAATARPGQFVNVLIPAPEQPPRSFDTMEEFVIAAAGRWPPEEVPIVRRPFSYYDSDAESGRFWIHGQVIGRGTGVLSRVAPGEVLDCLGPLGQPMPLQTATEWQILVGGGVGIAPFPFAARVLREMGQRVIVLCGAREPGLLPLEVQAADDVELPGGSLPGPVLAIREFAELGVPSACSLDCGGPIGYGGWVTELLEQVLDRLGTDSVAVQACGPWPMMRAVAAVARRRVVPCWVLLEEYMGCGAGACMSCVVKVGRGEGWTHKRVCVDGPAFRAEEILW